MPTVLIVDDLTADRKLDGALLSKITDLFLLYATNGLEALETLERHAADAIVTDMQMPEMNGLELVRTAKER
jgi:CheY-like chemotaxis protein